MTLRSASARPGTLIVSARFVCRHVSVLRALQAYGLDPAAAQQLVDAATKAGNSEIRFVVAPTPDQPGRTVIVRRMRGNHAEVWERPAPAGAHNDGKALAP